MQNNHVVSSIEFLYLYLVKSHNLNQYITVAIRLHLLMQNNHAVPSIELLCLYLANSHNLTHDITVVIRLHFLMYKYKHANSMHNKSWSVMLYQKVKPNNPGDIMAECSMLARYKHANSMHIQSWLFCIKNEAQ